MASSDKFKQEIQAGNIGDALRTALSEVIELEITTWVVSSDADGVDVEEPEPGHRMRTRINLVDGDIDNEVGGLFLTGGPYKELQAYHLDQVGRGREIIKSNLQSLQKLFQVWTDALNPQAAATSLTPERPLSPPPTLPNGGGTANLNGFAEETSTALPSTPEFQNGFVDVIPTAPEAEPDITALSDDFFAPDLVVPTPVVGNDLAAIPPTPAVSQPAPVGDDADFAFSADDFGVPVVEPSAVENPSPPNPSVVPTHLEVTAPPESASVVLAQTPTPPVPPEEAVDDFVLSLDSFGVPATAPVTSEDLSAVSSPVTDAIAPATTESVEPIAALPDDFFADAIAPPAIERATMEPIAALPNDFFAAQDIALAASSPPAGETTAEPTEAIEALPDNFFYDVELPTTQESDSLGLPAPPPTNTSSVFDPSRATFDAPSVATSSMSGAVLPEDFDFAAVFPPEPIPPEFSEDAATEANFGEEDFSLAVAPEPTTPGDAVSWEPELPQTELSATQDLPDLFVANEADEAEWQSDIDDPLLSLGLEQNVEVPMASTDFAFNEAVTAMEPPSDAEESLSDLFATPVAGSFDAPDLDQPPPDLVMPEALTASSAGEESLAALFEEAEDPIEEATPIATEPSSPEASLAALFQDEETITLESPPAAPLIPEPETTAASSPTAETNLVELFQDDETIALEPPGVGIPTPPALDEASLAGLFEEESVLPEPAVGFFEEEESIPLASASDAPPLEFVSFDEPTFQESVFEEPAFQEATFEEATFEEATFEEPAAPESLVGLFQDDETIALEPPGVGIPASPALDEASLAELFDEEESVPLESSIEFFEVEESISVESSLEVFPETFPTETDAALSSLFDDAVPTTFSSGEFPDETAMADFDLDSMTEPEASPETEFSDAAMADFDLDSITSPPAADVVSPSQADASDDSDLMAALDGVDFSLEATPSASHDMDLNWEASLAESPLPLESTLVDDTALADLFDTPEAEVTPTQEANGQDVEDSLAALFGEESPTELPTNAMIGQEVQEIDEASLASLFEESSEEESMSFLLEEDQLFADFKDVNPDANSSNS